MDREGGFRRSSQGWFSLFTSTSSHIFWDPLIFHHKYCVLYNGKERGVGAQEKFSGLVLFLVLKLFHSHSLYYWWKDRDRETQEKFSGLVLLRISGTRPLNGGSLLPAHHIAILITRPLVCASSGLNKLLISWSRNWKDKCKQTWNLSRPSWPAVV